MARSKTFTNSVTLTATWDAAEAKRVRDAAKAKGVPLGVYLTEMSRAYHDGVPATKKPATAAFAEPARVRGPKKPVQSEQARAPWVPALRASVMRLLRVSALTSEQIVSRLLTQSHMPAIPNAEERVRHQLTLWVKSGLIERNGAAYQAKLRTTLDEMDRAILNLLRRGPQKTRELSGTLAIRPKAVGRRLRELELINLITTTYQEERGRVWALPQVQNG